MAPLTATSRAALGGRRCNTVGVALSASLQAVENPAIAGTSGHILSSLSLPIDPINDLTKPVPKLRLLLGREAVLVDVAIENDYTSRRHAFIIVERIGDGGEFRVSIVDNGSANGTFVNNVRVESASLADGDLVLFGGNRGVGVGEQLTNDQVDDARLQYYRVVLTEAPVKHSSSGKNGSDADVVAAVECEAQRASVTSVGSVGGRAATRPHRAANLAEMLCELNENIFAATKSSMLKEKQAARSRVNLAEVVMGASPAVTTNDAAVRSRSRARSQCLEPNEGRGSKRRRDTQHDEQADAKQTLRRSEESRRSLSFADCLNEAINDEIFVASGSKAPPNRGASVDSVLYSCGISNCDLLTGGCGDDDATVFDNDPFVSSALAASLAEEDGAAGSDWSSGRRGNNSSGSQAFVASTGSGFNGASSPIGPIGTPRRQAQSMVEELDDNGDPVLDKYSDGGSPPDDVFPAASMRHGAGVASRGFVTDPAAAATLRMKTTYAADYHTSGESVLETWAATPGGDDSYDFCVPNSPGYGTSPTTGIHATVGTAIATPAVIVEWDEVPPMVFRGVTVGKHSWYPPKPPKQRVGNVMPQMAHGAGSHAVTFTPEHWKWTTQNPNASFIVSPQRRQANSNIRVLLHVSDIVTVNVCEKICLVVCEVRRVINVDPKVLDSKNGKKYVTFKLGTKNETAAAIRTIRRLYPSLPVQELSEQEATFALPKLVT